MGSGASCEGSHFGFRVRCVCLGDLGFKVENVEMLAAFMGLSNELVKIAAIMGFGK